MVKKGAKGLRAGRESVKNGQKKHQKTNNQQLTAERRQQNES